MTGTIYLKWNNHASAVFHHVRSLRIKDFLVDTTLVCNGKYFPVHRLVLSSCSKYFEEIFEKTPCHHPFIIVSDINHKDLEGLLNFMYEGKVNVPQDSLSALMKAAETLKIRGLAAPDESVEEESTYFDFQNYKQTLSGANSPKSKENFSGEVSSAQQPAAIISGIESSHKISTATESPLVSLLSTDKESQQSSLTRDVETFENEVVPLDVKLSQSTVEQSLEFAAKSADELQLSRDDTGSNMKNLDLLEAVSDTRFPQFAKESTNYEASQHEVKCYDNEPPFGESASDANGETVTERLLRKPQTDINSVTQKSVLKRLLPSEISLFSMDEIKNILKPTLPRKKIGKNPKKVNKTNSKNDFANESIVDEQEKTAESRSSFKTEFYEPEITSKQLIHNDDGDEDGDDDDDEHAMKVEIEEFVDDPNEHLPPLQTSASEGEGRDALEEKIIASSSRYFPDKVWRETPISEETQEPNICKTAITARKKQVRSLVNFKNEKNAKNHKALKELKVFRCIVCSYHTKSKIYFKKHSRSHNAKKLFKCGICSYSSVSRSALKIHTRAHSGEKPFKCGVCSYSSAYHSSLKTHTRTHTGEKPFKCRVCSYSSASSSALKIHARSHSGEKPFKCRVCSYSSASGSSLKIHTRSHSGEKPFKCNVCSYSSASSSALKIHTSNHTGEKPFKCGVCSYSSASRSALKIHTRTHSGEKPFKCGVCSYSSAYHSALKTHIRTHTGEKPFKCGVCSYSSASSSALKIHTRSHSGEKPFKCGICFYSSSCFSSLKKHIKIHS